MMIEFVAEQGRNLLFERNFLSIQPHLYKLSVSGTIFSKVLVAESIDASLYVRVNLLFGKG